MVKTILQGGPVQWGWIIKHPGALGKPFQEVWAEVFEDVADQVERVRAGEATWNKALLLLLERSGYPEETYHSFSYSPLFLPDGQVGGLLCVVTEETARVISERRLETLRHLGTSLATVTDKAAIRKAVASVFAANRRDFPFVSLHLAGDGQPDQWEKIFPVAAGSSAVVFSQSGEIVPLPTSVHWPCGDWDRPPSKAIAIAVPGLGEGAIAGSLVLALNPYRVEDQDILNVAQLIAGQTGSALANVAALDNERRRADRLWSVSRDLMLVIDSRGILRSVSPSWTRILGHPVEEVVGQHFSRFMHPGEVEASEAALQHALQDQELSNYANRLRAIDGSYHLIEWHTTMEEGLVYAYGRDVTEREEAQRQLERAREALFQSQKMEAIGQLTGGVAHDFNNLLMAVMSSLDLLRKRLPPDPLALRLLNNAVEGAQRGATLTQRMLAFARRQELQLDNVEVAQLLAGMSDLVQRSIGPEWPITTNFPLRLPAVRADANQLEMALLNLIVNARDATPKGGAIVILATAEAIDDRSESGLQPGHYVRIVVRDQGTGMDGETMRRATEPFFTTKGVGKGTGLGLPMVHGMAQQLGGTFELVSEIGKGTSAILWLPIAEHDMVPLPVTPVDEVPTVTQCRLTVLAVDDDALVLMNTAALLEDLGHEVVEAMSGAEALAKFRERPDIDLVMTDQAMPNMTGIQLVCALEELRPGVPVIIASGYGEGLEVPGREIERLGKPFDQRKLAEVIGRVMDRERAEVG